MNGSGGSIRSAAQKGRSSCYRESSEMAGPMLNPILKPRLPDLPQAEHVVE